MTSLSYVRAKRDIDPELPHYESLVHMLAAAVDAHPEVTAVIYEDRRITYAEFGRAVAGLARLLSGHGLGAGKRAILMMPNSIEMDVALMAVMATRAQVVPVNPFFTPHELSKVLADVDATVHHQRPELGREGRRGRGRIRHRDVARVRPAARSAMDRGRSR